MKRRAIRPGEMLAIDPRCVHTDRKSIWWDAFTDVPANEHVETPAGTVCVVNVRGSLEHHAGIFGDSYDAIRQRVLEGFEGEDYAAVVLRLDSPGGVVSGLNETVRWMRGLPAKYGKPLLGYVDELAASAAFAMSCACSSVYAPPDAIIGSIGVIATMFDQVGLDQKLGLNFVTLTSGDRKADGHPHVAISDDALAAETARVSKLATSFYKLVSQARPIPLADLQSSRGFEAGIFLAPKAAKLGLIDGTMSWDEFLAAIPNAIGLDKVSNTGSSSSKAPSLTDESRAKGNETDRKAEPREARMSVAMNLSASLQRLEAQLRAETDPEKRAAIATQVSHLKAAIEAGKQVVHEKHEKKTVKDDGDGGDSDDDGDDDSDGDDGDSGDDAGDDSEEEAEADDGGAEDDVGDEEDEAEEEEEEEAEEEEEEQAAKQDEEEARKCAAFAGSGIADASTRKKVRRAVHSAVVDARSKMRASMAPVLKAARRATGQRNVKAIVGALQAMPARLKSADKVVAKVEKLEAANRRSSVNAMLNEAKRAGKVTPAQMSSLREQGMKDPRWLKGHLAVLPRVVRSKEAGGFVAREGTDGRGAPTSEDQRRMRDAAMANMGAEERAIFEKHMSSRANGSPKI